MPCIEEYGFYGNVWVRQNVLERAGDTGGGHLHYHDHVSLLVSGSVEIQIEDAPTKTFVAPTFVIINKGYRHKITALEDNTVYYCVYAMRDVDGEVVDIYNDWNAPNIPKGSSPLYAGAWEPEIVVTPSPDSKLPNLITRSRT